LFFQSCQAIELGTDTLLIDEDTCATNFMIRDEKMVKLVAVDKEPITPFIRVVESLKAQQISTVLVVGGSGDFFDVADRVLLMDTYHCEDATQRAKEISMTYRKQQKSVLELSPAIFKSPRNRYPLSNMLRNDGRVKVSSQYVLHYGEDDIDLSSQEQLVSSAQINAIAYFIRFISEKYHERKLTIREILDEIQHHTTKKGLNILAHGQFDGFLMSPRTMEIGAAINRIRGNCLIQGDD
jgi:predicted ABC-class ATPase